MHYRPITSFRRALDPARLPDTENQLPSFAAASANKWEVLRTLAKAALDLDLNHRTLSVLQTLVSFYPRTDLKFGSPEMVVFPSNKTLCDRLNGMPCSTMRRHITTLVNLGLIDRRDSPNGKRYCRGRSADAVRFGFDLTPLLHRLAEIEDRARQVQSRLDAQRDLREKISLLRRDIIGLLDIRGPGQGVCQGATTLLTSTQKVLRRKLSIEDLQDIAKSFEEALADLTAQKAPVSSPEMSSNDNQNEQHHNTIKKQLTYVRPLNSHDICKAYPVLHGIDPELISAPTRMDELSEAMANALQISKQLWLKWSKETKPYERLCIVALMASQGKSVQFPNAYFGNLAAKMTTGKFLYPKFTAVNFSPNAGT